MARGILPSRLKVQLDEATDAWGIKVERVEMWVIIENFITLCMFLQIRFEKFIIVIIIKTS